VVRRDIRAFLRSPSPRIVLGQPSIPHLGAAGRAIFEHWGIAVFAVVLTAFYNALVYVGSVEPLVRTSYGLTVSAKLVLLFLLLLLAAYNRYVSVPTLGKLVGIDSVKSNFLSHLVTKIYSIFSSNKTEVNAFIFLKRAVRLEALLLGLLFCAALLRHEIPARHAMHGDHTGGPLHEHMRHLQR
jgi:hypothetical protein